MVQHFMYVISGLPTFYLLVYWPKGNSTSRDETKLCTFLFKLSIVTSSHTVSRGHHNMMLPCLYRQTIFT